MECGQAGAAMDYRIPRISQSIAGYFDCACGKPAGNIRNWDHMTAGTTAKPRTSGTRCKFPLFITIMTLNTEQIVIIQGKVRA